MNLARLFNAKHIAIIGGLEAQRVIQQCDKIGFGGIIYAVNPKRKKMAGRKCFKSVLELPVSPDAAYIAVNRQRAIEVVQQLVQKKCGGAICYAAGFAETAKQNSQGKKLQNEIVKAAGNMPLIGPNCYGFIYATKKIALWPDQHGTQPCKKGVAIITQSSNIAINLTMQQRALPIAIMLTAGNQAQLGISKLALYLIEQKNITALGLHIEGLDNVADFEKLAMRARQLKKPIVVLKVGKSQKAQQGTLTHTASMAGADKSYDILFEKLGIARLHELDTFIETLKLLDCGGVLKIKNKKASLLSMSCSGGEASLMADYVENKNNLIYENFRPKIKHNLKKHLGALVNIANPLDYNTYIWGDWLATKKMFTAALQQNFSLAMLVIDFPRSDTCNIDDWNEATKAFAKAVKQTKARGAVVASLPENMPQQIAINLRKQNIITLNGMPQAIMAAQAASFISQKWQQPKPKPLAKIKKYIGKKIILYEDKAKTILQKHGITIPQGIVITKNTKLNLQKIKKPYAVKAIGLAHKTEKNAVKLNLQNKQEIAGAIKTISSNNFLIETMQAKPVAELIVGLHRDSLGLMLTIGAGGIFSELHKDTISFFLPASENEIWQAMQQLKIFPLLNGYRGGAKINKKILLATIKKICDYGMQHINEIIELDINPLFVYPKKMVGVDALIIKRKKS